jgi:hypothetical protein
MLRALRIIQPQVRFVPVPCFTSMTSTTENRNRPSSSRTIGNAAYSYAPKDLPVYDYDLVVVGGGSGG